MPRKNARQRAAAKNLAAARAAITGASDVDAVVDPGNQGDDYVENFMEDNVEVAEEEIPLRQQSPDGWNQTSTSGESSSGGSSSDKDVPPPASAPSSRKRGRYTGESKRTQYRRTARDAQTKRTTRSILDFFKPVQPEQELIDSEDEVDLPPDPDLPVDHDDIDSDTTDFVEPPVRGRRAVTAKDIADLELDIHKLKDLAGHGDEVLWLRAILSYWRAVSSKVRGGLSRASKDAARVLVNGGEYAARKIRRFAREYQRTGEIPRSGRGAHSKVQSVINIPFVRDDVLAFLDERRRTTPAAFTFWLNNYLEGNGFHRIKQNTARKWMIKLGFVKQSRKNGVYYDGHDRPDVQHYLHETYLPAFEAIETRRRVYVGDDMDVVILPEDKSQPEIRIAFHDESIWYANDIEDTYYGRVGDQELPKKGQGRCVHVSDFLTEECGFLDLEQHLPLGKLDELRRMEQLPENLKSRVVIHPGKNHDGWWDCKQLLAQTSHFIDVFELIHPGDVCLAVFDCSSNHQAFSDDALVVSRMNVSPGGKQPIMRNTVFVHAQQRHLPAHQQIEIMQSMVFADDHPNYPGKAKGMLAVAQERGLIAEGARIKQRCEACKSTAVKDPTVTTCCLTRLLSLEPDFAGEKSAIQTLCEDRGHLCLFLPKFHCELNPIECAWCASKFTCRRECDYSFPHLKDRVPRSLDEIPIATVRRWFRLTDRFRDSYKRGLSGRLAEFAVRKYKSHRRLPATVANEELEAEFRKNT